jgi:hypothetical protein
MKPLIAGLNCGPLGLALGAFLAASAPLPAAAQTREDDNKATLSAAQVQSSRAVGTRGRLSNIYWTEMSEQTLFDMKISSSTRRLPIEPGVRSRAKIWTARADVCDLPGDEILVQIRSPLTCGSLGCEMMVASDAGGAPRVLMRTIGNSIDAPSSDAITINAGAKTERSWRYENARADYRLAPQPN